MTNAVELKVQTTDKAINLSLKSASQVDRTQIVNLIASLFNLESSFEPNEMALTISSPIQNEFKSQTIAPKIEIHNEKLPKKLPMIDSIRTEMVSFGEKLQAAIQKKESEPEFWKTGIKIDEDGTKRYKCRYTCDCGAKGNHYIPLKTAEVNCFECEQPLEVSLATGEVDATGVPIRDSFGNYYVAK
jgi:hypothetical protein